MKQVILCSGCGLITRRAGVFTAQLEKPEMVPTQSGKEIATGAMIKETIKLCRSCSERAGYKVREQKKAK